MKVKVLRFVNGKRWKVGDVVDVPDKLALLLKFAGKVEDYVPPPPIPKRRVTKKKVTAKKDSDVSANTYQTKVLKAED